MDADANDIDSHPCHANCAMEFFGAVVLDRTASPRAVQGHETASSAMQIAV